MPAGTHRVAKITLQALGATLLSLALWTAGVFDRAEYVSWDWRMRLVAQPSGHTEDIVVIALDQDSLDWFQKEMALAWPWPREVYARITDFCARAGGKSLLVDMLFTEPSFYGPEDDAELAQAFANFPNTALAATLGGTSGTHRSWPDWVRPPVLHVPHDSLAQFPAHERAIVPIPEIGAQTVLGNSSAAPDADGVHRRVDLVSSLGTTPVPWLGLAAWLTDKDTPMVERVADGLRLTNPDTAWTQTIPLDEDGKAIIRYHGAKGTYTFYSAAAVVQSELLLRQGQQPTLDPQLFSGKHILLGVTAPGLFDRAPTPMPGYLAGVEVQANILNNLLSDNFIRPASRWLTLLLAAGLALGLCQAMGRSESPLAQGMVWVCGLAFAPGLGLAFVYQGIWLPLVPVSAACLFGLLFTHVSLLAERVRQKRQLERAFNHYLAPTVVRRILKSGIDPGLDGMMREVSIFFSDIRKFSTLSETLQPRDVVSLLHEYFTPMTEMIIASGGTLDKFIGDAAMAFWNAPEEFAGHEQASLDAAMQMHGAIAALNPAWEKKYGFGLRFGIGMHCGPVYVGNMGTDKFMNYTIIGDNVNVASRLESLCSHYGLEILVSEDMQRKNEGRYIFQKVARQVVKGRNTPLDIYTVYAREREAALHDELQAWQEAVTLFEQREFARSSRLFAALHEEYGKLLYQRFTARAQGYAATPPPEDWDGAERPS